MRKTIFSALMFVVFAITAAYAGPFGTNMGDPKEKFGGLTEEKKDRYVTKNLPINHPDIDEYYLTISPEHGLVKISAYTKPFVNDAYGTQARSKFDELYSQLKAKYGKESKKFDFLEVGSIWEEPQYWAKGIEQNERYYCAFWETGKRKNNETDIESVVLDIMAFPDRTIIRMSYEYKIFQRYVDEKKIKAQDAL